MMYGYGNGIGGWGYGLRAIGMVLSGGRSSTASRAVRYARRDGPQGREPAGPPAPEPERLLAERFGRGEIDGRYHQRLTTLRAAGPGAAVIRTPGSPWTWSGGGIGVDGVVAAQPVGVADDR